MDPTQITMLPIEQWQEMRIFKFRYNHLPHPCDATIVFYMPLEVSGTTHNKDLICKRIVDALENSFGKVREGKRSVAFDNDKSVAKQAYDGGRPKVSLVVRMIPEIPVEEYSNFQGVDIYAYDYHMNIFLDYIGKMEEFNKELLITTSFEMKNTNDIVWGAANIETL